MLINMLRSTIILALMICFSLSSFLILPISVAFSSYSVHINVEIDVDAAFQNIINYMRYFSSLKSRVPGYLGHEEAANFIAEEFRNLGLQPGGLDGYFHYFNLTIPIDEGAEITVLPEGPSFKAYTLWPNMIQSCIIPPEGIEGELVYVGYGTLKELNGKKIKDNIALMEFNCGRNWLNVAKFGAKAVIFIEPYHTTRIEAETKFLLTPLYFPRIYISRSDAILLRSLAENGTKIRIKSRMVWEKFEDKNVVGVVKGTKYPNEVVIFAAHYDTWSIVPSLAPGADEAAGISTLLELARIISQNPPLRTVWFVALSGHYQALAGAREFTETYLFSEEVQNDTVKPWIFISYDLSSDSDRITFTHRGTMYGLEGILSSYKTIYDLFNQKYLPALKDIGYDVGRYVERPGELSIPTSYILDSEPIGISGVIAITYRTAESYRVSWGHPLSAMSTVNPEKLKPQTTFCLYTSLFIANEENFGLEWEDVKPTRWRELPGTNQGYGFQSITGDVTVFDWGKAFWISDPLLKEDYDILIDAYQEYSSLDPFSHIIVKADSNGSFTVNGISPRAAYHHLTAPMPGSGGTVKDLATPWWNIKAYVINRTSGAIEYAPDFGPRGDGTYQFLHFQVYWFPFVRIVVFKCGTLILYDILDPLLLKAPLSNINMRDIIEPFYFSVVVNNFRGHFEASMYSYVSPEETYENLVLIFAPPEEPLEILLKYGIERYIGGLLINASQNNPAGVGFLVKAGEQKPIPFTIYRLLKDFYYLNNIRLTKLRSYKIYIPLGEKIQRKIEEKIREIESYLNKRDFENAYVASLSAFSASLVAYRSIFASFKQVLDSSVFFGLLLIPFTLLFEKLLVGAKGKKKFVWLITIFSAAYLAFSILHPASNIATSFFSIILGFIVLFLASIALFFMLSGTFQIASTFRRKIIGPHFTEISRTSAFFMACNIGIENMRRRKFRTVLIFSSITLTIIGLLALTSITTLSFVRTIEIKGETPYNGMLVKYPSQLYPISEELARVVRRDLNATVSIRSWIFFPRTKTLPFPHAILLGKKGSVWIKCVASYSPEEAEITMISKFVKGRWFVDGDSNVAIISQVVSNRTGIDVGDEIEFLGLKLRVIGILDDSAVQAIKNLDGTPFSPQLMILEEAMGKPKQEYVPLTDALIVPYTFASKMFDAKIYNIAVKSENKTGLINVAKELILKSEGKLAITIAFNGEVIIFQHGTGFLFKGTQFYMIPMIISFFSILSMMMGSVYERKKEIGILSTVGLSPTHIAGIFCVESLMYGIPPAVLGYLMGIGISNILSIMGCLPKELYPSYASSNMIFTMSACILITLLGAIYPSILASKLVTPSLKRKWELPEPRGDIWEIPLPFLAPESEMIGFFAFLKEYFESSPSERFTISEFSIKEEVSHERKLMKLELKMALAPYGAGVIQAVSIIPVPSRDDKLGLLISIHRLGGELKVWKDGNRHLVDLIRKQMMIWRGLAMQERLKYIENASKLLKR